MRQISLRELLEAGCHFGHHVERWNPKAASFIFGEKNGVHIINLEKTKAGLESAGEYLKNLSKEGGKVIFVATKKQARPILRELAQKYNLMAITDRWPGGFLTNFDVVSKNFAKMERLEKMISGEESKTNTKKEKLLAGRELKKLNALYGTVCSLKGLPQAVVIVDTKKEQKIMAEAKKTGVKIVGLVDTNASPKEAAIAIPTNDDAVSAIRLVLTYLAEAVDEGRKLTEKTKPVEVKK